MGRIVPLSVMNEQGRELEELASQRSLKRGHARRVRVVLLAADGVAGVEIGRRLSLSEFAVSRIRRRFEEGGVARLADRSLRRTSFPSKAALRRHVGDFLADWNRNPTPFIWTKPARAIIRHRRRMLARTSRTAH